MVRVAVEKGRAKAEREGTIRAAEVMVMGDGDALGLY